MESYSLKTKTILNIESVLMELNGKGKKFEFAGLKNS